MQATAPPYRKGFGAASNPLAQAPRKSEDQLDKRQVIRKIVRAHDHPVVGDEPIHLRGFRPVVWPLALKARQKSHEFNKRYGKAVQTVREKAGLKRGDINGISEKQVARIEKGECRATSNAIDALAKAHQLEANDYMRKLAGALQ